MIYFRYIKMLIKSQFQYKTAMLLSTLGQFLLSFLYFVGVKLLFDRFDNVGGWSYQEVALCFGVTMCAFSLIECVARGFDMFQFMIRKGDFDRVMLRPRSTVLQVMGSAFDLTRFGRFFQGVAVLWIALHQMTLPPGGGWIILLMVLSGAVIFGGIFVIGATVCFFTVEGLEVINVFTDGGREMASYPLSIYQKWMRNLFTFVIPFGCFNYLPLTYLVGRTDGFAPIYALSPLLGMLFIIPCFFIWEYGVRHYLSTGS